MPGYDVGKVPGNQTSEIAGKVFVCGICGHESMSSSKMKIHLHLHQATRLRLAASQTTKCLSIQPSSLTKFSEFIERIKKPVSDPWKMDDYLVKDLQHLIGNDGTNQSGAIIKSAPEFKRRRLSEAKESELKIQISEQDLMKETLNGLASEKKRNGKSVTVCFPSRGLARLYDRLDRFSQFLSPNKQLSKSKLFTLILLEYIRLSSISNDRTDLMLSEAAAVARGYENGKGCEAIGNTYNLNSEQHRVFIAARDRWKLYHGYRVPMAALLWFSSDCFVNHYKISSETLGPEIIF